MNTTLVKKNLDYRIRIEIAREQSQRDRDEARDVLERLVRAAYPSLSDKCLCAKCLRGVFGEEN